MKAIFHPYLLIIACALALPVQGQGTWKMHVIDNSLSGADGVKLTDINNDGRLDVTTGWEEGGFTKLYLHPGVQEVKENWPMIAVGKTPNVEDAVFADMNNDGKPDVISCSEGDTKKIFVHWNLGKDLLSPENWKQEVLPASDQLMQWMYAVPLQLDNKNGVDLIAAGKNENAAIGWFESPANPKILKDWKWHEISPVGWVMSIIYRDMDADGDNDIIISDRRGTLQACRWLENPGVGEAQKRPWKSHLIGAKNLEVMFMCMADVNGDGTEEAVVCERTKNTIKIYTRLDSKGFNWNEQSIKIPESTGAAKSIEVGDINNDGIMDLVLSTNTNGKAKHGLTWLDGKNGFQDAENGWQNISEAHNSKYDKVELIDVDEDGDLDVLICEENFGDDSKGLGVVWYENEVQKKWTQKEVQKAIDYCEEKALQTLNNLGNSNNSPRTIPTGEKQWESKPAGGWTSGFWAGILWYVYEGTGNEKIKKEAEKFTKANLSILDSPVRSHDLGFIFNSSFGNAFRLTENKEYAAVLKVAADSLTTLFNENVGTILSWPAQVRSKLYAPHNTIIDNMMNLELLFIASDISQKPEYSSIAISHADVTMKNQIRPDSTVWHVLVYNDKTGACIRKCTHQGFADNSVWARGQAWAIYGYTMCYRETGDEKYLQTARELTAAYLKRLPPDFVPYWDFDDPEIPNTVRDASAAAVVASALLELSVLDKNERRKSYYRNVAEKMLWSLSSPAYLSGTKNDAFLLHSTGNKPKNGEVDIPIIYADYYYIEALVRLKRILETEKAG